MPMQSRRSVTSALSAIVSAILVSHGQPLRAVAADRAPETAVIKAWLIQNRISTETLDRLVPSQVATPDLRAAFGNDEVVSVGGILLPVSFCRYCLAAGDSEL